MDDDQLDKTPATVSWAVATGTAPLPFLAVYAILFLAHGLVYPVSPPDITNSRTGESIAGFIALALFVFGCLSLAWFVNRRRRWPFVVGQLATLVTAVDFVLDDTKGGRGVALLLVLTSLVSLVLALRPESWRHLGRRPPLQAWRAGRRRRAPAPPTAATGRDIALRTDDALGPDDGGRATAAVDTGAAGRYVGRRRAGRS